MTDDELIAAIEPQAALHGRAKQTGDKAVAVVARMYMFELFDEILQRERRR